MAASTQIHMDLVPKRERPEEWTHGLLCCHMPEALWVVCLPCCVTGAARKWHDGTTLCFNALCISPCLAYQLIRTENYIEGNSCKDIATNTFCWPCGPIRALREARTRAPPAARFFGGAANYWDDGLCDCKNGHPGDLFWALCCMPCASATVRTRLDGSSWLFNLFCTTPCGVRSLVRRKHLVHGDDIVDICLPAMPLAGCLDVARMLRYTEARSERRDFLSRHRRHEDFRSWTNIGVVGGKGRVAQVYGPSLVCGQMTAEGTRCLCARTREDVYIDGGRCTCLHPMHQHPSEAQVARCQPPYGVHDSQQRAGVGGIMITEQNHPEERNVMHPELADVQEEAFVPFSEQP